MENFNVGEKVVLYGRLFQITVSLTPSTLTPSPSHSSLQDCDEFTNNFLRKLGVRVPRPLQSPDDPYTLHRHDVSLTPHPHPYPLTPLPSQLSEAMQPLRPYEKQDTLRQFLDYDRQVLHFYCFWDDSDRYALTHPHISTLTPPHPHTLTACLVTCERWSCTTS